MFQGGSTLPATYFTQRRGCLRPWSVPSDVNVAPSHLGNAVTVTLRQQETHGNTLNDMNHVATSCAITVQGHHDNASRTKTFEAECAHYNSEKGRPRRQTKQLELSKNHCDQTDLQLQRGANDWKQMEMNGNDSSLNLAPIIHPLNIASSTAPITRGIRGIRKPSFPSTVDASLNTASTELHESENNAPGRHPSRDIDWHPINVMGRHEFANPRLESVLNNALHKPKGEMAPGPFPSKGSVSSATQLDRPSADAASTGKLVSSLFDDLKDVWTSNVTPDSIKCAEDVKTSVANGSAAQDHPKELGQRASPLRHRTQPGDLDKSDKKTRPSSDISVLPDVYTEKGTGMDVQDAALLLITTFKDLVHAPITSKSTLSNAAGKMGDVYSPTNYQAEEDITVNEKPKFTHISSLASRVTARGAMGRTLTQQEAEPYEVTGASTHSMICSYCSEIPCRKVVVALCKLCPRRFCLKRFRDDILNSNIYPGALDSFTRTLLQGQQGDILVESCPWCIQNRDTNFSLPPEGVSWMTHLLQELLRHDLSYCFREPVDTEKYPGYVQRIGRDSMMDLGSMMTKVKTGKYSSRRGPGQFIEDLRKIWKNCRKFARCDDLGKPTEGDDLPGIARCALILEAMSTKFVLNHTSSNPVQWHPSAWDYHNNQKKRREENERLRWVARKKKTSERKLIISRVGKGLKRDTSEIKRSDNRVGFYASTNKRLRLETAGSSNDGEEGKSFPLAVFQALPKEKSSSGRVSSVQQQAERWKPLEDLSLAAYSFSRNKKTQQLGNNVSFKIRRGPQ